MKGVSFNRSRQEAVCIYLNTVQAPSGTSTAEHAEGVESAFLLLSPVSKKCSLNFWQTLRTPLCLLWLLFLGGRGKVGVFFKLHLKLPWDMMLREEKLLGSNSKKDKEK